MTPHPVDIYVGKRLRSRRTILGMSQEELGEAVGVTFQQIQKYERGLNRISSSRLYEFSKILGISAGYFFEDYNHGLAEDENFVYDELADLQYERLNNKEVLVLVRAYYGISDKQIRKKVLAFIKSLSSRHDNDTETVYYSKKQGAA